MNASFPSLWASFLCIAALAPVHVQATPKAVEPFEASTWRQWQDTLDHPTVVVFTTTDCVHCPAVIEALAGELNRRKLKATLVTVVMDSDADDLVRDPHYKPADRLFAFGGQASAIRYSINPAWRGMTPYVALMVPKQAVTWVTGPPSKAQIEAWEAKAVAAVDQAAQASRKLRPSR